MLFEFSEDCNYRLATTNFRVDLKEQKFMRSKCRGFSIRCIREQAGRSNYDDRFSTGYNSFYWYWWRAVFYH